VHTYAEYEDEFRDKMKACDLPVDKQESDEPDKGKAKSKAKAKGADKKKDDDE
jgi:hypothetical protein